MLPHVTEGNLPHPSTIVHRAANGLEYTGEAWETSQDRAYRLCNIHHRNGRRAIAITYPCIPQDGVLDEYGRPVQGYGRIYLVAIRPQEEKKNGK